MKIGSAITFLLLALIALGYLLSDNINTREELVQVRQQNQQLSQEIQAIQAERDVANKSLAKSEQTVGELTQQNISQQEQIRRLSEESTTLKEQNAILHSQTKALKFFNSIGSSFTGSLSLALLLPLIPVSMAATYVIVRNNKKHNQNQSVKKSDQRKTLVQLTDEEIKEVIRNRRA